MDIYSSYLEGLTKADVTTFGHNDRKSAHPPNRTCSREEVAVKDDSKQIMAVFLNQSKTHQ